LAIPTVADNPDFSGSYTLTGGDRRADAQKATVVTITVVQTPIDVEITKLKDGQKMVNRVTLDGKSGVFNNLQGPFWHLPGSYERQDSDIGNFRNCTHREDGF
jgi:hypothetical protein